MWFERRLRKRSTSRPRRIPVEEESAFVSRGPSQRSLLPCNKHAFEATGDEVGGARNCSGTQLNRELQINGTNPSGPIVDGGSFETSTASFPFAGEAGGHTQNDQTTGAPRAYLNWLGFDRDNVLIPQKSGFKRITTAAHDTDGNGGHERIFSPQISIDQPGYVYIYLSNEEETQLEVFFDDFKVEHVKSPVVQMDDYYPFGLTFNSYSRENTTPQNYLYNSMELQDELNLGWYDYFARQYDPAIGRFLAVDPMSEISRRWSPYTYAYNNPIRFIDPDGMVAEDQVEKDDPSKRLVHTFKFDENSMTGTDTVREMKFENETIKDEDGNVVVTITTVSTTSATIDAEGNISEVSQSKTAFIRDYSTNKVKVTDVKMEVDKNDISKEFTKEVSQISAYKQNTKESPIQTQAKENSKNASVSGYISFGTGVVGAGLSFVPHPLAQGTSKALGVISAATGTGSYSFETNPEKIKNTKKY